MSVTPIRPTSQREGAVMKKRSFDKRTARRLQEMAYQVASIVRLVNEKISPLSGDEDPLDTATESATWSYALEGAMAIAENIPDEIGRIEMADEEAQS